MASGDGNALDPTARTTLRRSAHRGVYDRRTIYAILDEALICHVGFVDDGQPFVIPTIHFRIDGHLYIHGSVASRCMQCLCAGGQACITVTLLDGLVLARSAFHHSMNYRSVMVFGIGSEILDEAQKVRSLYALSEHVVPGRWHDARKPTEKELAATAVLSFPLDEASAKVRTGPPVDDPGDYGLSVWAGVIPLAIQAGSPQPDPRLTQGTAIPSYATTYRSG